MRRPSLWHMQSIWILQFNLLVDCVVSHTTVVRTLRSFLLFPIFFCDFFIYSLGSVHCFDGRKEFAQFRVPRRSEHVKLIYGNSGKCTRAARSFLSSAQHKFSIYPSFGVVPLSIAPLEQSSIFFIYLFSDFFLVDDGSTANANLPDNFKVSSVTKLGMSLMHNFIGANANDRRECNENTQNNNTELDGNLVRVRETYTRARHWDTLHTICILRKIQHKIFTIRSIRCRATRERERMPRPHNI